MYDKCMTKQNENRVADICNAVSVRSEADSNRCTRFCRPLPSHSAIRPYVPRQVPVQLSFRNYKSVASGLHAAPETSDLFSGASGVQIYKHF